MYGVLFGAEGVVQMDLCFVFIDRKTKLDRPGGNEKVGLEVLLRT